MEDEILLRLKAPFHYSKLSWRIGQKSKDKKKANMLVYIDSRDVQNRLDEVCGLNWSNLFKEVGGRVVCEITIGGQTRSDGAGDTQIEAEKGGLSDAFKRTAVQWGIGRYLYEVKNFNTWVNCDGLADYEIYAKNKNQLDAVAKELGRSVVTFQLFYNKIKNADNLERLEQLREEAGLHAREESWSAEQIKAFKEILDKKKEELTVEKGE